MRSSGNSVGMGQLCQFLLGRKFEIVTDHKPMEVLFGEIVNYQRLRLHAS